MKKILMSFVALLAIAAAVTGPARAQSNSEELFYTLDGTQTDGSNNYLQPSEITQGGITWSVLGNTAMNPWRIGGKSLNAVDRDVHCEGSLDETITKVSLDFGAVNGITVNSVTMIVASDAAFNNVIESKSVNFSTNSNVDVTPGTGIEWTNAYYMFTFNVTVSGSSNKYFQLNAIRFYYDPNASGGGSGSQTPTLWPSDAVVYDFEAAAAAGENPANKNGSAVNGQAFYGWETGYSDRVRQDYKGYEFSTGSVLPRTCHVWRRSDRINGNVSTAVGGLYCPGNREMAIDSLTAGMMVVIIYDSTTVNDGSKQIIWAIGDGTAAGGPGHPRATATIGGVEAVSGVTPIRSGDTIIVTSVTPAENGTGYIVFKVKNNMVIKQIAVWEAPEPETLLTTITATAKEQANYSTANVATVSFSYTSGGSSDYLANWGWWGYGFTATVTAAEGYTITKCIFYDDANRTATDSEAPFVVETTEADKTPRINGTPIDGGNMWSKGIKKIEVYGYVTPAGPQMRTLTGVPQGWTVQAGAPLTVVDSNADGSYSIEAGQPVLLVPSPEDKPLVKSVTLEEVPDARALSEATAEDVGKIIGADGNIYDNADAATAAGTDASAIIAYVGTAGSVDESSSTYKGLAIALTDANGGSACAWYTANSGTCVSQTNAVATALTYKNGIASTYNLTIDGHTHAAATAASSYGTDRPSGVSAWFLPSLGQWNLIVQGLATKQAGSTVSTDLTSSSNSTYKATNLNTVITAAGGAGLGPTYWSSTEFSTGSAWCMRFNSGYADDSGKYLSRYVRAVFAF